MGTLFIADLHLSADNPTITNAFLNFLKEEAVHADALYILGDLFELWIGDDDVTPFHQSIIQAIHTLTHQDHIPCYFIHGNRDFLINRRFARESGITLLNEVEKITLYNQEILILHGDILCTNDPAYQQFRRYMHNRFIRLIYTSLPLFVRRSIANKFRHKSMNQNQQKNLEIMDVSQNAVEAIMQQYQCTMMIHGHTHLPAIHQFYLDDKNAVRIVLGAWHNRGSMVQIGKDGSYALVEFPF